MSAKNLESEISAVDWNANVAAFLKDGSAAESLTKSALRLAVWSKQLEIADRGNPALAFVREMQVSSQSVAALTALALYKPAASAMRTMVETALYYTFFRTHSTELATLVRDQGYFLQKYDLVEYHKRHTPKFNELQNKVGLLQKLEEWYKYISSIVHGQLPGGWISHTSIAQIKLDGKILAIVVSRFVQAEELIHLLFLCTAGRDLWHDFSLNAKRAILTGMSADVKAAFELDGA